MTSNRLHRGSRRPVFLATLLAVVATVLLASCEKKPGQAAQTAVKVNKEEITFQQINFVLQQQRGLKPEQADAASKQILERLIDQELAVQKAVALELDRDPRVVQQIEAARREIVARAYLDKAGESAAKPTPEEVAAYYEANPALFKERRIYNLQELAIEARPEQVPELKAKLEASKSINDFVEYLKSADIRFTGNQAVRAAEQLPLASLRTLSAMRDGQALLNQTAAGAQVVVLAGSRSQPVALERATPAIEQYLVNERKREILAKEIKAMRESAKIEYVGKFAEAAAPTAASGPAAASAPTLLAPGGAEAASASAGIGSKQ
jgi:EpsD family peptidyl-prolyl cis-trans isomerase